MAAAASSRLDSSTMNCSSLFQPELNPTYKVTPAVVAAISAVASTAARVLIGRDAGLQLSAGVRRKRHILEQAERRRVESRRRDSIVDKRASQRERLCRALLGRHCGEIAVKHLLVGDVADGGGRVGADARALIAAEEE